MRQAQVPRLHVVTDDAVLGRDGFPEMAEALVEAAGDRVALHIRGPRTGGGALFRIVSGLRHAARLHRTLLLVNDRVDVALAASAEGVHLGERSLSVASARALLGERRVLGASVHGREALASVAAAAADFAFVGTVFPSVSHPGRPGLGLDGLARIRAVAPRIPVLGIGGVGVGEVRGVLEAGAHGVAVLGGIWRRRDPADAALDYLAALDDAEERLSRSTDRPQAAEEKP